MAYCFPQALRAAGFEPPEWVDQESILLDVIPVVCEELGLEYKDCDPKYVTGPCIVICVEGFSGHAEFIRPGNYATPTKGKFVAQILLKESNDSLSSIEKVLDD